ncbi:MAG: hypothetical protein ACK4UN_12315, partial [Limisphaerales bacterium]
TFSMPGNNLFEYHPAINGHRLVVSMSKKTYILIAAALVMGAIYIFKFTDWFTEKNIQIMYRLRDSKVVFGLGNEDYRLTSVKVVKANEAATNKYARAVWHLVAADPKVGSAPVSAFSYGQNIEGTKPAIPETTAEALEKNTIYRIFVEVGKVKGEREFEFK